MPPLDAKLKLKVYMALILNYERHMNVLRTFNLGRLSTERNDLLPNYTSAVSRNHQNNLKFSKVISLGSLIVMNNLNW